MRAAVKRTALAGVLAGLLLGAVPAGASADTFCVQPEASCTGPNTFATVQGALDAANGNGGGVRDTVLLGAATYSENVSDAGGNPVDIVGQGPGQTTVTSPGGFGTTTFAIGESNSTISALTIQLPATGDNNTGLSTAGDADGIAVTEPPGNNGNTGVNLVDSRATLSHSAVTMTGAGVAVNSFSGGTVRDSQLSGAGGFSGFGTVRRCRIASVNSATILQGGSTIENSLLQPLGGSGSFVGVSAFAFSSSFSVDLRNVTIAGDGNGGTTGIDFRSFQTPSSAPALSAAVTNTIIRGMGTDLNASVNDTPQAGTPSSQITIQSSDFDPAKTTTSGGGQILAGPGNINADPLFVDAAGGDFSLAKGSPAVDRGDNGFAPSGPDLAGAQRVADGDNDGEAIVDLGALELNPPATTPSVNAIAIPAVADPGEPVAFIADVSDPGGGDPTYAWSFDDGGSGDGPVEIHSFQDPGTHTGTVTVRNPAGGQASATASVQIRANAEQPPAAGGSSEQCDGKDATKVGTPGRDEIRGTPGRDVIVAEGGNDVVRGLGGADLICGGGGRDVLFGGPGSDKLFGGPGKDVLHGGPGHDRTVQ